MKSASLTLLDEEDEYRVNAVLNDGDYLVEPDDFERATGWKLTERGLCKDDNCIPVTRDELLRDEKIQLSEAAERLERPLAVETDPPVAYLGPGTSRVKNQLASGRAPDFTLPDWKQETTYSLSDFEGNKIFLLVWASW